MVGHTFEYNPAVAAAARHHPLRRARPGALHRLGAAEPRPLPARRERHLGPRAARHLHHLVPARRAPRWRRRCGRSATSARGARTSPTCGWTSRRTHAFVHVSWLNPDKVRRTTVVGEREDGRLRRHVGQRADPHLRHRRRPGRDRQPAPGPRDAGDATAPATSSRRTSRSGSRCMVQDARLRRLHPHRRPPGHPGRARPRHRPRAGRDRRRAGHRAHRAGRRPRSRRSRDAARPKRRRAS